ncbi:hypothetical protein GDO81_007173 [Engystomops pustulosus]|uniref:Uncharacterized protein n=1 Tax=Engystomops pustulosus TaxID=76066 RepID=A0AAV7C6Y7_ENGPU|nr:hypothetical protein GDO81_007173 [Engystomops pustulosus]
MNRLCSPEVFTDSLILHKIGLNITPVIGCMARESADASQSLTLHITYTYHYKSMGFPVLHYTCAYVTYRDRTVHEQYNTIYYCTNMREIILEIDMR